MRTFNDQEGKTWTADRIGRTSGIVTTKKGGHHSLPEPADIIRFSCQSDPNEAERETTMKAGLLANSSDADLISSLGSARKTRRR